MPDEAVHVRTNETSYLFGIVNVIGWRCALYRVDWRCGILPGDSAVVA